MHHLGFRRADKAHHTGVQATGEAGVDGGEHERQDLVAHQVDAQGLGQVVTDTNRQEGAAHQGAGNPAHQHDRQHQEEQHQVVERNGAGEIDQPEAFRRRDVDDAQGTVGERFPLIQQQVDDEAHAQGKDGEVVFLETQGHDAHQETEHRREHAGGDKGGPERPAVIHGEDRHHIGADGEEAAVGQVQLAAEAGDDVQAVHGDGPDKGQSHHVDLVFAARDQRENQGERQQHHFHGRAGEEVGNAIH